MRLWDTPIDERPKLPAGQRYLAADDIWQIGDSYNGNGVDLWRIGCAEETLLPEGSLVGLGHLCYWPRGPVEREYRRPIK